MSGKPEHSGDRLTNRAFRNVLLGAEEVVGANGMAALLRQANLTQYIEHYPPSDLDRGEHRAVYVTQLGQAIAAIYGPRGYRAILHRMGASQARSAIKENSTVAAAAKLALKFLPPRAKVKIALDTAVREINTQMGRQASADDDGVGIYYQDATCIYCIGVTSAKPLCYSVAGFVHGLLAWALDNENFRIEEVACRATGAAACRFRVMLDA